MDQEADDLAQKVLGYHRFRPPISSVDLSKEAGRPFARGEECIPSLLSGSHSFFPSLPWRLLPSGVRHARVLHGGVAPSFSSVQHTPPLPGALSASCFRSRIPLPRPPPYQASPLPPTPPSPLLQEPP